LIALNGQNRLIVGFRAGRVLEVVANRALAVFNAERQLGLPHRVDPAVLTART
jgi:hypothetical protein